MRIAKISELIGASRDSWEDAAQQAVRRAAATLAGITGFKVLRKQIARLEDGSLEYRVRLRLIFEIAPDLEAHM